jgi:hypothetical protein
LQSTPPITRSLRHSNCRYQKSSPTIVRQLPITKTDRLRPDPLTDRKRDVRDRERKAIPYVDATGTKLCFEENGHGYPIIFVHHSDLTFDNGRLKSAIFHAHTGASPTLLGAIHPAMSLKMPPCMAGTFRWTTSRLLCGISRSNAPMWWAEHGRICGAAVWTAVSEKVSAIVAANVGSGSLPSQRDAWLKETSVLSRIFIEHGIRAMVERMARGPARIQLKYNDRKTWQDSSSICVSIRREKCRIRWRAARLVGRRCTTSTMNSQEWQSRYCSQ